MKKTAENTPTMIHELALTVNASERRLLRLKFRGLKEIYNTLLAFLLKQDEKRSHDAIFIQNCKNYRDIKKAIIELENAIQKIKTQKAKKENQEDEKIKLTTLTASLKQNKTKLKGITALFDEISKKFGLTLRHCEKMATEIKNTTWMKDHLDGDSVQVLAKRVFRAYFEYKTGKRGKPRFKTGQNRLRSIEGKKNACISMTKEGRIKWGKLNLRLVLDRKDPHGVQAHALNSDIKFCRIIVRNIKGCQRYFVQLVLKNRPLLKNKHQGQRDVINDTVGLDIGVSTVAVASHKLSGIFPLGMPNQREVERKIARIQRKMSRSLRMMNPDCFESDRWIKKAKHTIKKQGKNIKRCKYLHKSQNYLRAEKTLQDLQRKNIATKTQTYHNLANEILSLGGNIQIEKNNYKAWQKGWFGKTLQRHAPSKFQEILERKAEKTGAHIEVISPFKPCFSQYCHQCERKNKKPLSQRIHTCCDINIQRDLYSAFLIQHYNMVEGKHGATDLDFNLFLESLTAIRQLPRFLSKRRNLIREENPVRVSPQVDRSTCGRSKETKSRFLNVDASNSFEASV